MQGSRRWVSLWVVGGCLSVSAGCSQEEGTVLHRAWDGPFPFAYDEPRAQSIPGDPSRILVSGARLGNGHRAAIDHDVTGDGGAERIEAELAFSETASHAPVLLLKVSRSSEEEEEGMHASIILGEVGYEDSIHLAAVGDLDGDGFADVLAGAAPTARCSSARPLFELLFVVYGGRDGLGEAVQLTAPRPCTAETAGWFAVSSLGDLDADGFADFGVASGGLLYLFYGEQTRLPGPSETFDNAQAVLQSDRFFVPILLAGGPPGDFNADGYSDLLIHDRSRAFQIPGADVQLRGRVLLEELVPHAATSDAAHPPILKAASLSDFDGDGIDDFFVATSAEMHLFYGREAGFAGDFAAADADTVIEFGGYHVSKVEVGMDMNQDGLLDVVVFPESGPGPLVLRSGRRRLPARVHVADVFEPVGLLGANRIDDHEPHPTGPNPW